MATYAVLDASGNIINRIVLDDVNAWTPEDGHSIVEEKTSPLEIGGSMKGGKYVPPKAPASVPIKVAPAFTPAEKLAATGLTVADLKALLK
jgi:hypothetical protein